MNATQPPTSPPKKSRLGMISAVVLLVFAVVGIIGIVSRTHEERQLKKTTEADAVPAVAVITARQGAPTEEIVLPGTVQAWHGATIYARTGGYLKSWTTDIGAKVKEGDVLAEIDAPDLDAQFHQAQADLNTAEANNKLAQITAKRWLELLKTNSVSKQDADTKVASAEADQAMVESAKANLDHLQQQEDFKKVTAPFDGTITARNTDVGALVIGSNNGTGQDLFHIADLGKLRVYVQVPENDADFIQSDMKAELHFPEHPQEIVTATLGHKADALDPTNRTLLVEFEVDNANGNQLSGGYADAHIKLPTSHDTVLLPINATLFRDKMQVAVVGKDNHVTLRNVMVGRDYGNKIEIVSGIAVGDTVVVNPSDSLEDGQEVRPTAQDVTKDQPAK